MFFGRKDEDDEYERYMKEREAERDNDFSGYGSDRYAAHNYSQQDSQYTDDNSYSGDTHHDYNCGEETCEYARDEQDLKYCMQRLTGIVRQGERVFWAGSGTVPFARNAANGCGVLTMIWIIALGVIVTATTWDMSILIVAIIVLLFVCFARLTKKGENRVVYAVTDTRLITLMGTRVTETALQYIADPVIVNRKDEKADVAYKFTARMAVSVNGRVVNSGINGVMFGLKDAEGALKALNDAAYYHGNN